MKRKVNKDAFLRKNHIFIDVQQLNNMENYDTQGAFWSGLIGITAIIILYLGLFTDIL